MLRKIMCMFMHIQQNPGQNRKVKIASNTFGTVKN